MLELLLAEPLSIQTQTPQHRDVCGRAAEPQAADASPLSRNHPQDGRKIQQLLGHSWALGRRKRVHAKSTRLSTTGRFRAYTFWKVGSATLLQQE